MHIIDKSFDFCYGHRVWNQVLDKELSLGRPCACRRLHGHQGKVSVYLSAKSLNEQGMVTDFVNLSWLKQFLDDTLDHKFMIDQNDPLYDKMVGGFDTPLLPLKVPGTKHVAGQCVWTSAMTNLSEHEKEYYEGFVVVDFMPTSEHLSKWIHDIIKAKMPKVNIARIDWWETPKSRSTYIPGTKLNNNIV